MLEKKTSSLKELFSFSASREATYEKIIDLGRKLNPLKPEFKIASNRVSGCQSIVYLRAYKENNLVFLEGDANALISAGLVYILLSIYSGETAETILTYPPTFLEEMGIYSSLSLTRSHGLNQMCLKLKQLTIPFLINL